MQRWQLTVGLGALALAAAVVAPELRARRAAPPTPEAPPIPQPETPAEPPPTPTQLGSLVVEAGLDRTALLRGVAEDRYLTITVRAPDDVGEETRRPLALAVALDASGSMLAAGKIDHARAAAKHLVGQLDETDQFGLVAFSDDATTVVPMGRVFEPAALQAAIDRVPVRGGTNLFAGLERGRDDLGRAQGADRLSRLILLSDGQATAGITDPESLKRLASQIRAQGVTVSTIGLGADFNEDLLAEMADLGGGTYAYVNHPKVLSTVFNEELRRSASVVARGVALEVRLPDGVQLLETLGWTAHPSANGVTVDLGDVYAGETRKIVMRVKARAPVAAGAWEVAQATARYEDLVLAQAGSSSAVASVELTDRIEVARRSVDKVRAAQAAEAVGNKLLDESTRAFTRGDVAEAKELANRSQGLLEKAAADYDAPALAAQAAPAAAAAAGYDAWAPTSEEGQSLVKDTKQESRKNLRR